MQGSQLEYVHAACFKMGGGALVVVEVDVVDVVDWVVVDVVVVLVDVVEDGNVAEDINDLVDSENKLLDVNGHLITNASQD